MSSYEELEYFFESSGLDYGPEILVTVLALISVVLGVFIARCMMKSEVDEEQKAARKALAQVLNEEGKEKRARDADDYRQEDDEMFDVPLNDDHNTYEGPDLHSDMIRDEKTDEINPAKYYSPSNTAHTRISDIVNQNYEDEYTFDVEL